MMLATNILVGLIVLLIGAPLYFLVVTALYRITLEFFMVIFRMAEDIRALRERGEIRYGPASGAGRRRPAPLPHALLSSRWAARHPS